MRANELMIGDWICYKGRTQMPARVLSFNNQTIKFDNGTPQDWLSSIENFEPVPLTAEILEKNGFQQISTNKYVSGKVTIAIFVEEFLTTIKSGNARVMITIKYVHELQHILRLCGIDKEIEL